MVFHQCHLKKKEKGKKIIFWPTEKNKNNISQIFSTKKKRKDKKRRGKLWRKKYWPIIAIRKLNIVGGPLRQTKLNVDKVKHFFRQLKKITPGANKKEKKCTDICCVK